MNVTVEVVYAGMSERVSHCHTCIEEVHVGMISVTAEALDDHLAKLARCGVTIIDSREAKWATGLTNSPKPAPLTNPTPCASAFGK